MKGLRSFFSRSPRLWAFIAALLAALESLGPVVSIFSSRVVPEFIAAHAMLWSVPVIIPVVMAVAYLIWSELTTPHIEFENILTDVWMVRSLKVLTAYTAVMMGWVATLMAFGARGPFGADIMRGISGPELPLDEKYWALVFLVGVALALFLAKSVVDGIRLAASDGENQ